MAVLLGAFVGMPWREDIAVLEGEISANTTQLDLARQKLNDLKEAEKVSEESPDEVLDKVPRNKEQSDVIRAIDSAAQTNGFVVTQMSFNEREDSELKADVLTISLVAEGNINTLKDFLSGLENGRRFMAVETINVKRSSVETSNRATVNMTVSAYSNRS